MALKISANGWFTVRYLTVDSSGVVFRETAGLGGELRFSFGQIDAVLLSQDNWLSLQVGLQVYRLPVKPNKPAHKQAIDVLLAETRRTLMQPRPIGAEVL